MTESPEERDNDRRLWQRVGTGRSRAKPAPCPDPQAMAAYLESRLTSAQREGIEHHLARCAACLETFVELRGLMGLPPLEPARDLRSWAEALVAVPLLPLRAAIR